MMGHYTTRAFERIFCLCPIELKTSQTESAWRAVTWIRVASSEGPPERTCPAAPNDLYFRRVNVTNGHLVAVGIPRHGGVE